MDPTVVLLSAFLISIIALGIFIWSMRNGAFHDPSGAQVIFTAHEVGRAEDPAAAPGALTALQRTVDLSQGHTTAPVDEELVPRAQADRSSAARRPARGAQVVIIFRLKGGRPRSWAHTSLCQ